MAQPPAPAAIPKIDVHLHIDPRRIATTLAILAENRIEIGLNASGGEIGAGLEDSIQIARNTGGRLQPFCNIRLSMIVRPDFD